MQDKRKIAFYWCASCGGCEESVIDMGEDLLLLEERAAIVFWPIVLDVRYQAVAGFDDREIDITFINGAVRMEDQEKMVKLLRSKSKVIVAQGACAQLGGVVGLANLYTAADILERTYLTNELVINPDRIYPGSEGIDTDPSMSLSAFHSRVRPLDQVIAVDYYIPGCPPPPELVKRAVFDLIEDRPPADGKVFAESKALCDTCPRRGTRPEKMKIDRFERMYAVQWDPEVCFLPQGLICLGPATRGGCNARCIRANMPCRGCFGPTQATLDQGAKMVSLIAALANHEDEKKRRPLLQSVPDLAGLCYRYSLAASLLQGGVWGGGS